MKAAILRVFNALGQRQEYGGGGGGYRDLGTGYTTGIFGEQDTETKRGVSGGGGGTGGGGGGREILVE